MEENIQAVNEYISICLELNINQINMLVYIDLLIEKLIAKGF